MGKIRGPLGMNFSGLSLRDLEYVLAVADHGSFVRAAEHCRVAQPSLSAQVRKLESSIGIVIFERTTRKVLVTADGRAFIDQARRVLAEADLLFAIARRSDIPFGGSLRLAAISTLGPYLFPRILLQLRAEYPKLGLILREGLTENLLAKLTDGAVDAILLSLPQADPAISTASIFTEPFLLACPKGHPATRKNGPSWDGLDAEERLLLEEGHCLREQALAACATSSPSHRHGTSLETLKYMVAAGEGCTLVPVLAAGSRDAAVYRRLPSPIYSRTIGLAWRRSDPRRAEFLTLVDQLRNITRALDADLKPMA